MAHQGKTRSSNIELLRIVAIFMIIVYHIVVHCARAQLLGDGSAAAAGVFGEPVLHKRAFLLGAVMPWGPAGNALFILISGYFMVGKGSSVDLARIVKKLLFQLLFALLVLVGLSAWVSLWVSGEPLSLESFASFNDRSWFVGYYFSIILIAQLGFNNFLLSLDRKAYRTLLLSAFAAIQFSWSAGLLSGFSENLQLLATGLFLYALGWYIRTYDCFGRVRASAIVLLLVAIYGVMFVSYCNTVQNAINDFAAQAGASSGEPFAQPFDEYGNSTLVPLVMSVCIFELFRRIHMPSIRAVNFIGAGTFMVYLFHDNDFFYSIWNASDWISMLSASPVLFVLELLGWAAATFAAGLLVYVAYVWAAKAFGRCRHVFLKPAE